MKSIFAIAFIISTCAQVRNNKQEKFSVSIWDYNNSMAYTTFYKINNDSIIVSSIGGLENETNKVLLSRTIKDGEKSRLYNFLSTFPLDTIATEYKNPLVQDGDQKRVEIVFTNKKKTIDIENVYQRDMDRLFTVINDMLEKNLKIRYAK